MCAKKVKMQTSCFFEDHARRLNMRKLNGAVGMVNNGKVECVPVGPFRIRARAPLDHEELVVVHI